MKSAVISRYGSSDSFSIKETPQPEISKSEEILVKVNASSVNPVDWKVRKGQLKLVTGIDFPKILGADFSGEVVEIGEDVKQFKKGDKVYGMVSAASGGAYAEYLKVEPKNLALKPEKLTDKEAAAVPLAALTALQSLKKLGKLAAGKKVLINGASGGVGTFAVQIAKAYGAEVTGVCSGSNVDLVKGIGADHVINYETEKVIKDKPVYHLVFDTHGNLNWPKVKKALLEDGLFVTTVPSPKNIFWIGLSKITGKQKMKLVMVNPNSTDLSELKTLIDEGKVKPVIDSTYDLKEIAEAHDRSETGHVRGKIVVTIPHNGQS